MRSLPQVVLYLCITATAFSQNPHGTALKIDCRDCHTPDGWKIDVGTWQNEALHTPNNSTSGQAKFDHGKTGFELENQHAVVDCRACHESLVFSEVGSDCISCHLDLHQQTVGTDCSRCHDSNNWLVDNITEIHQENGFPLLGNHQLADCKDCHFSETYLRFDRIGNQCIDCHLEDYNATSKPNHMLAGYSTDCTACHDMTSAGWLWTAGAANHQFFPLTGGHLINDCTRCHIGGNFINTPTDCFACHESDFKATTSPDHEAGNFPTDCKACHTTDPGWSSESFTQHDQSYFPIFSGKHKGEWNECVDCHTTPGNFKAFSCTDCHEHNNAGDLADEHDGVNGYSFSSAACYSCHPKGN